MPFCLLGGSLRIFIRRENCLELLCGRNQLLLDEFAQIIEIHQHNIDPMP